MSVILHTHISFLVPHAERPWYEEGRREDPEKDEQLAPIMRATSQPLTVQISELIQRNRGGGVVRREARIGRMGLCHGGPSYSVVARVERLSNR